MFDPGELVLKGWEVTLRPLAIEDIPALVNASGECRDSYLYTPVPDGLPETEAYVKRALSQRVAGERYPFTISWCGAVVGTTSYCYFQPWKWPAHAERAGWPYPDATEIGHTWLAASAQRTRCNTETKYLLLRHAFESWRVLRVSFRTDARNVRSRHAIERLGAVLEGVRRAEKPAEDGTARDSASYSIVAAEWSHVRERLLAQLRQEE